MFHSLDAVAAVWLALSIAASLYVAYDVTGGGHPQPMWIMSVVWPLTILYWGPAGLIFYFWFGRTQRVRADGSEGSHDPAHGGDQAPMWQAVFKGATHCGAGCASGDFVADWIAYASAVTLAGSKLGGKLSLAFVFAYAVGVVFQYFSIAPMRGLGLRDGLIAAVKADTLSLVAYEVGMFACMIAFSHAFPSLEPTRPVYWVLMQAAMIVGFATTYPVNWWLISQGWKERM
ncbi:DUF4396 domain-containing protein [Trinickia sp.]|uniref:DUF4396 domain-containing protein n=1 Tax=Trinickia sp. TaxID=2571163 RepID=UPI003F7D6640